MSNPNHPAHQPVPVHSLGQLAGAGARTFARPIHIFDVPEKLASKCGVKRVGLVELTAEEELLATKRASNNPIRLAFELAKESLRQIDGSTISTGDGTADVAWNNVGAQLRTLIISAYNDLHNPTEGDLAAFMKSRQVQVG